MGALVGLRRVEGDTCVAERGWRGALVRLRGVGRGTCGAAPQVRAPQLQVLGSILLPIGLWMLLDGEGLAVLLGEPHTSGREGLPHTWGSLPHTYGALTPLYPIAGQPVLALQPCSYVCCAMGALSAAMGALGGLGALRGARAPLGVVSGELWGRMWGWGLWGWMWSAVGLWGWLWGTMRRYGAVWVTTGRYGALWGRYGALWG